MTPPDRAAPPERDRCAEFFYRLEQLENLSHPPDLIHKLMVEALKNLPDDAAALRARMRQLEAQAGLRSVTAPRSEQRPNEIVTKAIANISRLALEEIERLTLSAEVIIEEPCEQD